MKWENGKLQTAVITSNIGGTLRIRTQTPLYLNGEKLSPTTQEVSDNPLLQSQSIRKPLIAANAPICIRNMHRLMSMTLKQVQAKSTF